MKSLLIFCVCLMALPAFGQGHIMEAHESNPPADLLMSQTFNEGQGAKDWSENNLAPTFISTPVFSGTNGVSGNDGAYYFVNPTSGGDDAIDVASLARPLYFTLSAWIYAFDVGADFRNIIGAQGGGANSWQFRVDHVTDVIRLVLFADAGVVQIFGGPNLSGAWHHVAATLSRSGGGVASVYVDGVLIDDDTGPLGAMDTGTGCAIGRRANATAEDRFDGRIDNTMVFDRALSVIEINDLYQKGKAQ